MAVSLAKGCGVGVGVGVDIGVGGGAGVDLGGGGLSPWGKGSFDTVQAEASQASINCRNVRREKRLFIARSIHQFPSPLGRSSARFHKAIRGNK